ncbi:unnamed protein product [Sphagnum troendelagicum]
MPMWGRWGLWMPLDCYNRSCCGGSLSLNWRSSSSSSSLRLLLPLFLLVLLATATIAPCSTFVDAVHICCTRLDPTCSRLRCVAAGRTLVVVGVEFITEGDFAGRVPVALAVVRIWN